MVANLFCLFIGVLGRDDCEGHSVPITHIVVLTRRISHGAFQLMDLPPSAAFKQSYVVDALGTPHEVRRKEGRAHEQR